MRLGDVAIPEGAQERAWRVVSAAFEQRIPNPRPRRRWALAAAGVALAGAIAAAAVTAPGRAVLSSVRDALGVEHAATIARLPAPGRLLVNTPRGAWILGADGTKRNLGRYRATWSPHGLYELGVRGHELAALDPKGSVRWALERPAAVSGARWSGDGYRVAYLSGSTLRVVAGDGTGDHLVAAAVAPAAPAWYGVSHQLAYADRRGRVHLVDADTSKAYWVSRPGPPPLALSWTASGKVLVALTRRALLVLHYRDGSRFASIPLPPGPHVLALSPTGPAAVTAGQTEVLLVHPEHPWLAAKPVFHGAGAFSDLVWSPDGHWLLASWTSADQWVLIRVGIRSGAVQQVRAIAAISGHFDTQGALRFGGWTP